MNALNDTHLQMDPPQTDSLLDHMLKSYGKLLLFTRYNQPQESVNLRGRHIISTTGINLTHISKTYKFFHVRTKSKIKLYMIGNMRYSRASFKDN